MPARDGDPPMPTAALSMPTARRRGPLAMRRLTRRRLLQGAAIASAGLALGARWPAPTAAASDATGWIALTRGRDLVLTRPDGSDTRLLLSGAMGEFVFDVTLSPDGTRLVYGLFTSPSSGAGGADLMMLTVVPEVGQPTLLVSRDGPGVLLGAPCWTPDGRAVVFEAVGVTSRGQPAIRADLVNADGSGRQTLVESGRYPAVSPD